MADRVGFLAGCFDLMHPGYIKMFADAKSVCDYLVVAIQDDPTIDRPNLHKQKPVQTLAERTIVLSSIKWIDRIVFYRTEKDLYELLNELDIDVRILGTDYVNKTYTGDDLGIEIHFHNRDHSWSTTDLKNRIRRQQ
jgi:glycerol-3-phosphate cytidylyltransferase